MGYGERRRGIRYDVLTFDSLWTYRASCQIHLKYRSSHDMYSTQGGLLSYDSCPDLGWPGSIVLLLLLCSFASGETCLHLSVRGANDALVTSVVPIVVCFWNGKK